MKKDKKWLESVIIKELMTNSGNHDMTTYEQGRVSGLKYFLNLINQLDEPKIAEEQAWKTIAKSMNRPVMFWENMRDDYLNSLKEPEPPVISQFVADRIEEYREIQFGISLIFMTNRQIDDDVRFSKWLSSEKDNCEIVARAWLDGYAIEKEKMYRVKFAKATKNGDEMYLEKNDREDAISIDWSSKDFVENEDPNDYLFTEQEIKAIDERYWAFAEEVTDNV